MLIPEKTYATINAGRIAYTEAGRGRPHVVLVHGIPTSSYLWREVVPRLADAFHVVALDMLGYGDSDKPTGIDLSVAAQSGYLRELLDGLGIHRAALVGHDIGGGVVQIFAAENPDRVERLVLIDSIAYDSWPEPGIARLKDPAWDQIMETLDLAKGFRKALGRGIVDQAKVTDELAAQFVRPWEGIEGRRAYLRAARALDNRDTLTRIDQIERTAAPTLILWGEQDVFQNIEFGRRLAGALPDARLEIIPNAGHWPMEDKPEEVARLIREFLKQVGRDR